MSTAPAPSPASPPPDNGFLHPQDYLLFGLLVRHGLCTADAFPLLVEAQRDDFRGQPLLEFLAELNDLPATQRANINELLELLGTPKLREMLPQELPALRTLVQEMEATRTQRGTITPTRVLPDSAEAPTQVEGSPDAPTWRGSSTGQTLTYESLDDRTRTQITQEEITRIERARVRNPLVGTILSGHLVVDQLGAGGQGEVYLAKQLSLNRYVALKRLEVPHGARLEDFVRTFRAEAQTLARINHSRIVKVFEIFETGGQAYFTMEYLQGKTIKDLVRDTDGPLPMDVVANIACQACSALGRTSEDGLVHRDIKPANMMLDENGDLKIVDFGLAAAADQFLTGQQNFAGTPLYCSPEQLNLEPLDARTDQYSLGLTLYYALTGDVPWKAKKIADLQAEQKAGPVDAPSTRNESLPRAVDRVLLRMLHADPKKRFSSFGECFKAWQQILADARGEATAAPQQLLGEALLSLSAEQRKAIKRNSIIFVVMWLLIAVGTVLGEWRLRGADLGWVLDAAGDWGTLILIFSLACIAYVAAARNRWVPVIGSLRAWLYVHIATAVPAVALLLIHSGNFLHGLLPGGSPAKPVLSLLMSFSLLAAAISGSVGLLIFRTLRRQLSLQAMELRAQSRNERAEMFTALSAQLLSGWRLVHYPIAFFFVFLSLIHIWLMIRMGG